MNRLAEKLFYIWVLSLPFYRFSLFGTLSLDNLLGPILIVLWLLIRPSATPQFAQKQEKNIFIIGTILAIYFFAHTITLINTQTAGFTSIYIMVTDLSYFVVPLLYVRNERVSSRMEDCILAITLIGAISAFLSAIGLLHLEVTRYSTSRIDIEGLDLTRSIGLFGAFGDMALLSAFSIMLAMSPKRKLLLFVKRSRFMIIVILLSIFLGLVGSQSRNMIVTIVISIFLFMLVRRWSNRNSNWIPKFYALLIAGGLSLAIFLGLFWEPLTELLSNWGGKQASGTAHGRLEQYQLAWELLKDNPLTGAAPELREAMINIIAHIHNMWLKELVQGGLIAVFAMIALIIHGMRNATRCLHINPGDETARITLVLLVAMIVSTQFNPSGTSVFWMLLGFSLAKISTTSNRNNPHKVIKNRHNMVSLQEGQ